MKLLAQKAGLLATLVFFLLSNTISAKRGGVEKTRNINETYTISANHKIEIDNKFGEVKINSWDKNEVVVKVNIKVADGNEKRSQDLLDRIKIDVEKTGSSFSVKTIIDGDDGNLNIKTKGSNGHLSIDYEISVPANNLLSVKNSFGPIIIDQMSNSVKIDLKFGAATIGALDGNQNDLSFEFCDPVVISKFYKGKISLKFSKLELLRSEDLVLTSEMSSSKVDKVTKSQFYLKFGSLDLNDVYDLILESQMSTVNIKTLHKSAKIKNKYGALEIAKVRKSFETLDVKGEFSPIRINLEKGGSYQVDALSKMAGLKLPPNSIQDERPYEEKSSVVNNEKEFKGRIGSKSEKASTIKIQSSFGEVKLMLTD